MKRSYIQDLKLAFSGYGAKKQNKRFPLQPKSNQHRQIDSSGSSCWNLINGKSGFWQVYDKLVIVMNEFLLSWIEELVNINLTTHILYTCTHIHTFISLYPTSISCFLFLLSFLFVWLLSVCISTAVMKHFWSKCKARQTLYREMWVKLDKNTESFRLSKTKPKVPN